MSSPSSTTTQNPARNHHYLPRFYLRGFVASNRSTHIYVYERDKPYVVSPIPEHRNPSLLPIKKAAMELDFYSYKRKDGTTDYDGFEEKLKQRENEDALLLRRVVGEKNLRPADKLAFARFMMLMHKRSPGRQVVVTNMIRNMMRRELINSEVLISLDVFRQAAWRAQQPNVHNLMRQLDTIEAVFFRQTIQHLTSSDQMRLQAMMADYERSTSMLAQMNWYIFQSPKNIGFVASDAPVFLSHSVGRPRSEVLFPLSHELLLVTGWTGGRAVTYQIATEETVDMANRVMASQAHQNIYYCESENWVAELFNRPILSQAKNHTTPV